MASGKRVTFPPLASASELEWLGGLYSVPITVREGDSIIQPDVLLWLELPSHILLAVRAIDPRAPAPIGETLLEVMSQPTVGPPRRPTRVRVSDRPFADAVRSVLGEEIPVVIGPVPELDAVFDEFSEEFGGPPPDPTYLGDGIVPPLVKKLFYEAARFYRKAPWDLVDDDQVIGVDIPELGVKGYCLSIIGGVGEAFGFLLFSSFDEYERFPETGYLSLNFEARKDLPPAMVAEVKEHRWPVAGAKAYPVVMVIDEHQTLQPANERDYRIVTACAAAFVSFLAKQPYIFDDDNLDVAEETFRSDALSVTLSVPHPDDIVDLDAVGDPAVILEAKTRFYETWLDEPVSFLDGKSPRAAARSTTSRRMLEELLLLIEEGESTWPEGHRIDVNWLRRELGIV